MSSDAANSPFQLLRQIALSMRASRALDVAARLGVADALADGARSSAELAIATSTDAHAIRRVMRALTALGVFAEVEADRFALNPVSELLQSENASLMRAGVQFLAGDLRWRLYADLLETVRTGQPAPERVLGCDLFTYCATDPEESALFDAAMAATSAGMIPALLAAYDFSGFSCLLDLGGGTGGLLGAILAAHPALSGVLFDLPHVVAGALAVLQAMDVAERCRIEAGSFFDTVPSGVDALVLKQILHDWDDERASVILARCCAALSEGGTLLVLDRVMPERAEAGRAVEAYLLDLEMLVTMPGGRERTESEFRALLTSAGFISMRVFPTTSPLSIIEARLA